MIDDARAVAEQEQVGFAGGARHFERVEQGKPFGVAARSRAKVGAEMNRSAQHRRNVDRPRIGAASAVEIDFDQRASDQASTKVPSLRNRRAA